MEINVELCNSLVGQAFQRWVWLDSRLRLWEAMATDALRDQVQELCTPLEFLVLNGRPMDNRMVVDLCCISRKQTLVLGALHINLMVFMLVVECWIPTWLVVAQRL